MTAIRLSPVTSHIKAPSLAQTWASRVLSPAGVALFVGLVALAFRVALLLRYPFDGLYGQDAYFYLDATRSLSTTWTDPARLWQWLTAAGTPPISVWPLGYHLQMALAGIFTSLNAASGQIVSLAAGTLTPVWTSLLTIALWQLTQRDSTENRLPPSVLAGAALAGMVMAVSSLAVNSSLVVMSDMAGAHWATLGVLATALFMRNPKAGTQWGWFGGICLGI